MSASYRRNLVSILILFAWGGRVQAEDNIAWHASIDSARQSAIETNRLVLLHFTGDRCAPCKRLEKKVFSEPAFGFNLIRYCAPVKINATASPQLAQQFKVNSWPTDIILTTSGQELHRMTSPQDARDYISAIRKVDYQFRQMQSGIGSMAQFSSAQESANQQRLAQMVPAQIQQYRNARQQTAAQPGNMPVSPTNSSMAGFRPGPAGMPTGQAFSQSNLQSQSNLHSAQAAAPFAGAPAAPLAQRMTPPPTTAPSYSPAAQQAAFHSAMPPPSIGREMPVASPIPTTAGTTAQPYRLTGGTEPNQPTINPYASSPVVAERSYAPPAYQPSAANRRSASVPPPQLIQNEFVSPPTNPMQQALSAPTESARGVVDRATTTVTSSAQAAQQKLSGLASPSQTIETARQAASSTINSVSTATRSAAGNVAKGATSLFTAAKEMVPPMSSAAEATQTAPSNVPSPALAANPTSTPSPSVTEDATDPPVGLEGYCCVTLADEESWEKGDPRWGARHRGMVYLFQTAAAQQRFLADPDSYSPMLAGYDPVEYYTTGKLVSGRRAHGVRYQNRTFLFETEESLQKFWAAPEQYVGAAYQAMTTTGNTRR